MLESWLWKNTQQCWVKISMATHIAKSCLFLGTTAIVFFLFGSMFILFILYSYCIVLEIDEAPCK